MRARLQATTVRADIRIRYQDQAQKHVAPRIASWATPHAPAFELEQAPASTPTTVTRVVSVARPGSSGSAATGGANLATIALYAVAALAVIGAVAAVALAAVGVRRRRQAERALRIANAESLVLGFMPGKRCSNLRFAFHACLMTARMCSSSIELATNSSADALPAVGEGEVCDDTTAPTEEPDATGAQALATTETGPTYEGAPGGRETGEADSWAAFD